MLIALKELKPNPFREFTVDPIDEANVDALAQSIEEHGFWGGVVCRRNKAGEIEIGAGHHRIRAAIKAGIKTADLFVGDLDDPSMIRVYAIENATQRGNSSSALAGSIASAIRFLAKAVMLGDVSQIWETSVKGVETVRGQLASEKGLGEPMITRFLAGVPGINKSLVWNQLGNLKASGDYDRIIKEVGEEIERENKAALIALAKAEKEAAEAKARQEKAEAEREEADRKAKQARDEAQAKKAAYDQQRAEAEAKLAEKRRKEMEVELAKFDALRKTRDTVEKVTAKVNSHDATFDHVGVARHLKNPTQVTAFRQRLGELYYPVPVNKQAELARRIVQKAAASGEELTAAFIRMEMGVLSDTARLHEKRRITEEERRAAQLHDAQRLIADKFKEAESFLVRAAYALEDAQRIIREHGVKKYSIPGNLVEAIKAWDKASARLKQRF